MKNKEIREAVKHYGLKMWMLADALHIQDSALSRKLRYELSEDEKSRILSVIQSIGEAKANA